ncbi:MAG: ABC transporter ATP-binding protein [Eubacteriales bacterium]|nr:ABC transporter ATP-binding protein [Eubacteriales bacterium]
MSFIEFKNVYKRYRVGESEIVANRDVNFTIEEGELAIIVGPSGAGKSTVLNILGGMDRCDEGHVFVDGKDITTLNERDLTTFRRYDIGFVFQFYNLIPNLTVLENVELATQIVSVAADPESVLAQVGLSERLDNFPTQISGGEQQRVAIARALAKRPKILLCDEPTGALDYTTSKQILKLLQTICAETGTTVVIITHNMATTPMADRVIEINDAHVRNIQCNSEAVSVDTLNW